MKQVICINWGPKYGAVYINRLYGMVARNLQPPFRFICFTDSRTGVRPEVECHDIPDLDEKLPTATPGIWRKSALWNAQLADLAGPVLFLDLDVVITNSLDPFFAFGSSDDVVMARNVAKPLHRFGQTSIYRFPVGSLIALKQAYSADPQAIADRYRYEQHFVTAEAPNGVKFWPKGWVRHFRIECVPPFPLNLFRPPTLPRDARVVIFAGSLNPPDAIAGRLGSRHTHRTAAAHLRHTLRHWRGFRALRRYNLPAPWVADAWQE